MKPSFLSKGCDGDGTTGFTTFGGKCIFPFRYKGVLYLQCTTDDHDKLWCSTETDQNDDYVDGQWENCELCKSGKDYLCFCFWRKPLTSTQGPPGTT